VLGGSQDGIATIAYPLKTQSSIATFGNGGSLFRMVACPPSTQSSSNELDGASYNKCIDK
jgi:hypothetical protein